MRSGGKQRRADAASCGRDWGLAGRYAALMVFVCSIAGCANDVAMQNPRTGETATCAQSLAGWNPWSQTYACAAAKAEQGWRISGYPY
jgi:hypothetical protein